MSADNWIYILTTTDWYKTDGTKTYYKPLWVKTYRVAHAQAIENLQYYLKEEKHNIGAYLYEVWWESPVFYKKKDADEFARKMYKGYWRTEYWICTIDMCKYNFYM